VVIPVVTQHYAMLQRNRGQHEPRTGDEGRDRWQREHHHPRQRQQGNRKAHLRQSQPEDLPPQRPELLRAQFQPDDEQEHHHAKFREMQDRVGVVNSPSTDGPTSAPAAKYPSTDPSPRRRNSGTAITAAPISTTTGPMTGPNPSAAIGRSFQLQRPCAAAPGVVSSCGASRRITPAAGVS
jgi:hypothetical protein